MLGGMWMELTHNRARTCAGTSDVDGTHRPSISYVERKSSHVHHQHNRTSCGIY
jgi:hypothetical protein